jgi:hypothetical protein
MSEMEKAQIIHDLKQNFNLSQDMLDGLLQQIEDENLRKNFERITKGLTVEDNYKMIFSSLPWVKNINGIHQNQEKKHKKDYQAPDYSLLVENSQKENFPILVDVKSVKGEKITCTIMQKQIVTLKNYARDHKAGLLIAIYWEKIGYWTHNSLSNFIGKKKNKITLEEAIKNDLSHILSDYSFIIHKPFYRKTIFSGQSTPDKARHESYGDIKDVFIGQDLDNLITYSIIESSIIDAAFKMTPIDVVESNNGEICQIEMFSESPMIIKISKWLINFLSTWQSDHTARIDGVPFTEYGRIFAVNLMHDLGYQATYQIPDSKNKETEFFFEEAYKDTVVMNHYKYFKEVKTEA